MQGFPLYITTIFFDLKSDFKLSGKFSSVINTLMSSTLANVYGITLPIFELSNIMYVNFAFERNIYNCSASIMLSHEKPFSGVNADAEIMASSKLTCSKYTGATDVIVDRLSFFKIPPSK